MHGHIALFSAVLLTVAFTAWYFVRNSNWIDGENQDLDSTYGRCRGRREFAKTAVTESYCPDNARWLDVHIREVARLKNSFLVVFVGCNKGYDLVNTMRYFSNNETYKVEDMREQLSKLIPWRELNGACNAGLIRSGTLDPKQGSHEVEAWCIEPIKTTVDAVQTALSNLKYFPAVKLLHAGVSSFTGRAQFNAASPGQEDKGMQESGMHARGNTRVVTLDSLFHDTLSKTQSVIDFLSIDTEGNDFRVVIGALNLLTHTKVLYLEFEYHSVGKWATSDLEDLVDMLDHLGFDCYFAGNMGQLWRLTGCWDDTYRILKTWSNVACTLRTNQALYAKMEEIYNQTTGNL